MTRAGLALAVSLALAVDMHSVTQWFNHWGYLTVFVPVFVETAGIPVPGETVMLLAGAASSLPGSKIQVGWVMVVGAVAAIAGDNVGYAIGRFGGRRLILRLAGFSRVDSMLDWGERFFERHGGKTVFLARWTAGLRIFGAWIAGMTRMSWPRFFLWNALGGITWAVTVVYLGYVFARSLSKIESYIGTGGAIAAGVVLVAALVVGLRSLHHRQDRRREREQAAFDADAS